jgi:hypothetical protein
MRVKKLTAEHIGREVKSSGWSSLYSFMPVIAIAENWVWLMRNNHVPETMRNEGDGFWIIKDLPKEKKKPSERISELIGRTSSDPEWQERAIESIIQFLDEEFEKKERE